MSRREPPNINNMVSLKVDNLTYRTGTEELRRIFERCGEVGDIYIPRDRHTKESRGFAFVRYYDKRDAEDALKEMDGRMLDGRELRVQMARYGRPTSPQRGSGRGGGGRDRGGDRDRRRRSRSRDRRRRSHSRGRKSDKDSRSRSNSKSSRGKESRSKSPVRRSRSRSRSYHRRSRS